ncbi:Sec23/Sec24, trunk domain-containing protein [Artemisia annua]|uniref:Sec23/Sec24, trunk domain-containing protein n=1 Tax=Artemisia annua TaxID=35608 RepID=A0A2U1NCT9_ARTAN|nr:Sec23/Sec24, trunk domain-containing protein [Artemisia annua]
MGHHKLFRIINHIKYRHLRMFTRDHYNCVTFAMEVRLDTYHFVEVPVEGDGNCKYSNTFLKLITEFIWLHAFQQSVDINNYEYKRIPKPNEDRGVLMRAIVEKEMEAGLVVAKMVDVAVTGSVGTVQVGNRQYKYPRTRFGAVNTPAQPLAKTFFDKGKEKLYAECDPNAVPPSADHYTPYMNPMQIHRIEGTFSTFIPTDVHSVPSVFMTTCVRIAQPSAWEITVHVVEVNDSWELWNSCSYGTKIEKIEKISHSALSCPRCSHVWLTVLIRGISGGQRKCVTTGPSTEGEILQSFNFKSFTFSELKTRRGTSDQIVNMEMGVSVLCLKPGLGRSTKGITVIVALLQSLPHPRLTNHAAMVMMYWCCRPTFIEPEPSVNVPGSMAKESSQVHNKKFYKIKYEKANMGYISIPSSDSNDKNDQNKISIPSSECDYLMINSKIICHSYEYGRSKMKIDQPLKFAVIYLAFSCTTLSEDYEKRQIVHVLEISICSLISIYVLKIHSRAARTSNTCSLILMMFVFNIVYIRGHQQQINSRAEETANGFLYATFVLFGTPGSSPIGSASVTGAFSSPSFGAPSSSSFSAIEAAASNVGATKQLKRGESALWVYAAVAEEREGSQKAPPNTHGVMLPNAAFASGSQYSTTWLAKTENTYIHSGSCIFAEKSKHALEQSGISKRLMRAAIEVPAKKGEMRCDDIKRIEKGVRFAKLAVQQALEFLLKNALLGFAPFGTQVQVYELGYADISMVYLFQWSDELCKEYVSDQLGLPFIVRHLEELGTDQRPLLPGIDHATVIKFTWKPFSFTWKIGLSVLICSGVSSLVANEMQLQLIHYIWFTNILSKPGFTWEPVLGNAVATDDVWESYLKVNYTFWLQKLHPLRAGQDSRLLSLQERLGEFYNLLLINISMAGAKVQEFEAFIFFLLSIFCCDYMYSSSSNLSVSFHFICRLFFHNTVGALLDYMFEKWVLIFTYYHQLDLLNMDHRVCNMLLVGILKTVAHNKDHPKPIKDSRLTRCSKFLRPLPIPTPICCTE